MVLVRVWVIPRCLQSFHGLGTDLEVLLRIYKQHKWGILSHTIPSVWSQKRVSNLACKWRFNWIGRSERHPRTGDQKKIVC